MIRTSSTAMSSMNQEKFCIETTMNRKVKPAGVITNAGSFVQRFYRQLLVGVFVFFGLGVGESWGQVSITSIGTAVTENFNGMGASATATIPTGFVANPYSASPDWNTGVTATAVAYGTSGTGIVTGTSPGGIVNWANGITASSTDRALGFLPSGSGNTAPNYIILKITNNTGVVITSLSISFDYEKYRSGSRAFNWTFFHGASSNPTTSASSGDQSYAADANNTVVSNPPTAISKSVSLSGLSIANGANYYLKWAYTPVGTGGSTNGQGIGIDNFSITAACTATSITSATAATNTVCAGATTTLTANGIGGTNTSVTWYSGPGATGTNYGSGTSLPNAGAGTYYAYVTGDCGTAQASVTVNSYPVLTVTDPADQAVCNGGSTAAVNFTGTAGSFIWTNNNPSIGLGASGSGNIPSFTAINGGISPVTATITVTPSTATAYVPNNSSNSVSIFNTVSNSVTGSIPVGVEPRGIAVSPDGARVYVANRISGTVSVISTATNSVITTVTVGAYPTGVAVSPNSSKVYVANLNSHTVSIIDATTFSVTTITGVTTAHGVAVSPDGTRWYVTNIGPGGLMVFNANTNALITTVATGAGPHAVTVSPNGSRIYVANMNSGNVTVIDGALNSVITTIATGGGPRAIAVNGDGSKAYVTNYDVNTVSVINTVTNTVSATVPVGTNPVGISISPDYSSLIVANVASNTISIINASTNAVTTYGSFVNPISFGNFISAGGGCTGTPQAFSITVNPTPVVTAPANQTYCNGETTAAINLSGTPTGVVFDISGGAAVGLADVTNVTAIPSFTAITGSATVTITPKANGCSGTAVTYLITVNALPTVTCPANSSVCINTASYALTGGSPAGGTYSGTGVSGGNFDPAVAGAGMHTITYTYSDGNCSSSCQFTITVNASVTATASIVASPSGAICAGTSVTFTATAANLGGGSVSNYEFKVNGGSVQSGPSNIYTTSTLANGDAVTCEITVTGGTCLTATTATSNTITMTVQSIPVTDPVSSQTVCNGLPTAAVSFTGPVPGTQFNWTNSDPSIGLAASGSGNIASFVANNPTNVPISATITVTPVITTAGGFAYVTETGGSVAVINTATNSVVTHIPVPAQPFFAAVSPNGSRAYVTSTTADVVSVINTSSNAVVATIPVGTYTSGIAVSPDGSKVYAVNTNHPATISVIDASTNALVTSIPALFGGSPRCVSFSPDGSKAYVTNATGYVSVINTATNTIVANVGIGSNPEGVVVSSDGNFVYAACSGPDHIAVINTTSNTLVTNIPVGPNPMGLAISPDGSKLYVCNNSAGSISVINTATNTVATTITGFNGIYGLSITSDGSRLYVPSHTGNSVYVVSTSTNSVVATIPSVIAPITIGNFITAGSGLVCTGAPTSFTITVNPTPDAGTNGTLTICSGETVTAAQLFAALGGSPDNTGTWSPTPAGAGTYTYTVNAVSPCTGSVSATVVVSVGSYTITSSAGPGGSITPTGVTNVSCGGNQAYTITANSGYVIGDVSVDGGSVGAVSTYTFSNVTANHTIVASFKAIVEADPTIVSADITDQSDVTINANLIPYGSSQRVHVILQNLSLSPTELIPSGTTKVRIDLGTRLVLDPLYVLGTAPLSAYFSWSKVVESGHDVIYGDQIADIPEDFTAETWFDVNTSGSGSSVVTTDFLVTNHNNPTYFLQDANTLNNHTTFNYTVLNQFTVNLVVKSDVSCYGGSNGSITVQAAGGAVPYQYKNGAGAYQSSGTFSGLTAGTYIITAKDNIGQLTTISVTITEPTPITFGTSTVNHVSCFGGSNGSVVVSASGGTGGITYSISPNIGTQSPNGTFNGLTAGSYTITATDENNCTAQTTVTVNQPTQITFGIPVITHVSCFGGSNGSVVVSASGGTGTITYSISPNVGTQSPNGTFNGLTAGSYTITATDGNNCIAQTTVTVNQPTQIIFGTSTVNHVTCNGGTNGSVVVSASGGTGGITYTISPNVGTQSPSGTFNGLTAGSYTITATDGNNCTAQTTVTVNQPTQIIFGTSTVNHVSCFGGSNGSVVVSTSGGTGGITYTISPNVGTQSPNGTFNGLTAGSYTITATDENNCTAQITVTVNQPTQITFGTSVITHVSCFGGSNGSVVVSASGGTGTITYSISPNAGTQSSPGTFSNLPANTYIITATDGNNCTAQTTVTVNQPTQISFGTSTVNHVSCFGGSNGSVVVSASGGTGAITYSISPNIGTQSPNGTFNGLTAGSYTITATDGNNCTAQITVTVNQPTQITFGIPVITHVSCFGGTNGSIVVSASGGTGGITYTISPNVGTQSPSGTFNGLTAGSYTITATDENNCTAQIIVTVNQPTQIIFGTPTVNHVSCFGGSNGSVVVSASGGTGIITYSISPNAGTQSSPGTFSNLPANTYIITATDGNNCTAQTTVAVNQPTQIIFGTPTVNHVSCFGGSNGSVVVSASGGTGTITYSISPNIGTQSSPGTFTGLSANTYTITATDENNCTAQTTVTVNQPAQIIFGTSTVNHVSCFGGSNGSVVVSTSGGTGGITYTISPNAGTQSSPGTFSNLPANTYIITATDGNNCTAQTTVTVNQPTQITFGTPTVNHVTCNGGTNGSVVVSTSGGTGGITYTISPNVGTQSPSGTFNGLTAGSYTITATDGNNCIAQTTVTVNQPTQITFGTPTVNHVTCNAGTNGSIVVSTSGGTGTITYSISPNAGTQSSPGTFSNLPANTYIITATDENNCTAQITVTVNQPTQITFGTPVITHVTCFGGSNGSVVVSTSGGTGAITYSISPNIGTQSPNGTFNGLTAGNYTITATDGNNCTAQTTVAVNQPTQITFGIPVITHVSCFGGTNGSIVVSASGGTGGITYTISPNVGTQSSSGTFTGLSANTYIITATDENNCTAQITVTVNQPTQITFGTSVITHVSCFGGSNGSIVVSASGGTGTITYSISPNIGTQSSSGTFTGLSANTYTITATDENNCTAQITVTVNQPSAIIFGTSTVNHVSCFGGSNGSVVVSTSGGTGTITYSISPNVGTQSPNGTFNGLTAGSYTITATDENNCTAQVVVMVTEPAVLVATASGTNVSCNGGNNGTATVSVTGGTLAYGYSWSASGGGVVPVLQVNNQSLNGLLPGIYTVTVTDAHGCTSSSSYTVTEPTAITALTGPGLAVTHVSCNGANNGAIDLSFTAQGGTPGYTYTYAWTKAGGGFASATEDISGLAPGVYTVVITVTDNNNCSMTFSGNATVTEPAVLNATVTAINHVSCAGGSTGSVTVTATGGTPGYEYSLGGGPFLANGGNFTGLAAGTYTVTARDANGCLKTVTFTITESLNTDITLGSVFDSNIFTANGQEITIVYNITEIKGKAATPVVLRIYKPAGYTVLFDNSQTSMLSLSVDNQKWQVTTTNSLYYEISRTGPGGNNTISCNEFLRLGFKIKRNTFNISVFNLNAQFRTAAGELILNNNTNSILLVGE